MYKEQLLSKTGCQDHTQPAKYYKGQHHALNQKQTRFLTDMREY